MKTALPPTRYKVVERGRRLVTVDTQTGLEVGLLPSSPQSDLSGTARAPTSAPPPSPAKQAAPSALNPVGQVNRGSGLDRSGRLAILIVGGLVAGFVLIISGAWVFVAIAMALPPVRAIAFAAAKTAIARFLDGGGPA